MQLLLPPEPLHSPCLGISEAHAPSSGIAGSREFHLKMLTALASCPLGKLPIYAYKHNAWQSTLPNPWQKWVSLLLIFTDVTENFYLASPRWWGTAHYFCAVLPAHSSSSSLPIPLQSVATSSPCPPPQALFQIPAHLTCSLTGPHPTCNPVCDWHCHSSTLTRPSSELTIHSPKSQQDLLTSFLCLLYPPHILFHILSSLWTLSSSQPQVEDCPFWTSQLYSSLHCPYPASWGTFFCLLKTLWASSTFLATFLCVWY